MSTYRTGNHWGVTIVREGERPAEVVHHMPYAGSGLVTCCDRPPFELPRTDRMTGDRASVTCANRDGDQLVAVVVNGDTALAERICALLNASNEQWSEAISHAEAQVSAALSLRMPGCICNDPPPIVDKPKNGTATRPPGWACPKHGAVL